MKNGLRQVKTYETWSQDKLLTKYKLMKRCCNNFSHKVLNYNKKKYYYKT